MENKQPVTNRRNSPQIKVCGLTNIEEMITCASLGADAVGFVFYPKSPRNLTEEKAREMALALPATVTPVGVFVNEKFSEIMRKVERCFLRAVQLHGQESPRLVTRLLKEKLLVIKALFSEGTPSFKDVSNYEASAYLVECGKGWLPGGNACKWDWKKAKRLGDPYPLVLAGGLAPENVYEAVTAGEPDAVDVSSGVESAPGRKNPEKIKSFIDAVSRCDLKKKLRRIFNEST
jgi:phosphoribosylanthranilate isomerase